MFESIKLAAEPYLIWIKVAAVALVFVAGCYVTHLYYAKQLSDAVIARQTAELKLQTATSKIEIQFVKDTQVITTKGKDRVLKVTEYVPALTASTSCAKCEAMVVTEGFVEYHNAAVDSRDLKVMTSDEIVKPSTATMQSVAGIVNANYTTCNKYRIQIEGLQALLLEVQKVHNK